MILTAEDRAVAKQMGLSEEAFAKSKAAAIAAGTLAADPAPARAPKKKTTDTEEETEETETDGAETDDDDVDALKERIAELEAENEELREQLDAADEASEEDEAAAAGDDEEPEEDAEGDEEAPKDKKKPTPAKGKKPATPAKPSAEVARLRAELKLRDKRDAVTAVVNDAGRAGKVTPADRAKMIQLGMKLGVPGLKTALAAMPNRVPKRRPFNGGGGAFNSGGHVPLPQLSAADRQVCKQMGITEEAFARSKADLSERGIQ